MLWPVYLSSVSQSIGAGVPAHEIYTLVPSIGYLVHVLCQSDYRSRKSDTADDSKYLSGYFSCGWPREKYLIVANGTTHKSQDNPLWHLLRLSHPLTELYMTTFSPTPSRLWGVSGGLRVVLRRG